MQKKIPGMRQLRASLRRARPANVQRDEHGRRIGIDSGRPKEMSGRQWKRLKRAQHRLAQLQRQTLQEYGAIQAPTRALIEQMVECRRQISRAHNSCDRPHPGHPYIGGRRLRTTIEL